MKLTSEQQKTLKQAKEIQNVLIKDFKKINEDFAKNGIKWYAHGATLLGAWRNNKFVPWDDDIDMFMTMHHFKNNFKKIRKIVNSHGYELYSAHEKWHRNREIYVKLFKSETVMIDGFEYRPFIDIFLAQKWTNHKDFKKLYNLKYYYSTMYSRNPFMPRVFGNWVKKKYFKKFDYSKSDNVMFIDWKAKIDFSLDVSDSVQLNFENTTINAPKNYRAWLSVFYKNTEEKVPAVPEKLRHIYKNKIFVEKIKKKTVFVDNFEDFLWGKEK